jgi:hypothetical protein
LPVSLPVTMFIAMPASAVENEIYV